jgi:hypothetical protein
MRTWKEFCLRRNWIWKTLSGGFVGVGIWDRRRVFLWHGTKPGRTGLSDSSSIYLSTRTTTISPYTLFDIQSCLETTLNYKSPLPDHNTTSPASAITFNNPRTSKRLSISEAILPKVASLDSPRKYQVNYPRKYQVERDLSLVETLDKRAHRNLEASPTNEPAGITAT